MPDLSAVERWFTERRLPCTPAHVGYLRELGVLCVEDLKLLEQKEIDELFKKDTKIAKRRAAVAFNELGASCYDHKNAPVDLPLESPPQPPAKKARTTSPKSTRALNENNEPSVLKWGGFSRTTIKTAEEKKAEREERQRERARTAEFIGDDDDSSSDEEDDTFFEPPDDEEEDPPAESNAEG